MPKFIVEVELDGYDSEEEMLEVYCNEDAVAEALRDYGFYAKVERIEEND